MPAAVVEAIQTSCTAQYAEWKANATAEQKQKGEE